MLARANAPLLFLPARLGISLLTVAVFCATLLVADSGRASNDASTATVGAFGVGGSATAGINEQTGAFEARVPAFALPGLNSGVGISLSYVHDLAAHGADPSGMGAGWTWGVPRVQQSNGEIRVLPASGGVFVANESLSSGLERYALHDLKFSQQGGLLPARNEESAAVPYTYTLDYPGGKDYFSAEGHLISRLTMFGERSDYSFSPEGELRSVTDSGGNTAMLSRTPSGVVVTLPPRTDGQVATVSLAIERGFLMSVTDPVGQRMSFTYSDPHVEGSGLLLAGLNSSSGAQTTVTYQSVPSRTGSLPAVETVRTSDFASNAELSVRTWKSSSESNHTGYPKYYGQRELGLSDDSDFRYVTELSDGATRVASEFNSLGLMIARRMYASVSGSSVELQEQLFDYPGTDGGRVPAADALSPQYSKPTHTAITFRDVSGGARTAHEYTSFDETGRMISHATADGTTTTTEFDESVPTVDLTRVPGGLTIPVGLISRRTTIGVDGTVSMTVNQFDASFRSIERTETLTGMMGGNPSRPENMASTSRTSITTNGDGFVTEQRVKSSAEAGAEGPDEIVTRFDRAVDSDKKLVTVTEITAADSSVEQRSSTTLDLVSGLQVSTTDPTGRTTSSRYDRAGRIVGHTDEVGNTETVEHGINFVRSTNPIGVMTCAYTDALGRSVETRDNLATRDGVVTTTSGCHRVIETREYRDNGSTVVATDVKGLTSTAVTDVFGRPSRASGPNGLTTLRVYDDVENTVTTAMLPSPGASLTEASRTSTVHKDEMGRDVSVTGERRDRVGVPSSSTSYDGLGRMTRATGNDVTATTLFNADGTPKTVTTTPASPEKYPGATIDAHRKFDLRGSSTHKTMTSSTGESKPGVTVVSDAAGRVAEEVDQAGHATTIRYTVDSLPEAIHRRPTGVTTTNTYDDKTRTLVGTETRKGDEVVRAAFEHDALTGAVLAVYDPDDRAGTQVEYAYDLMGNIVSTRYPDGNTVTNTFDEYGQRTQSTDITGNTTRYTYDRLGLLDQAKQTTGDGALVASVNYKYDVFGRTTSVTRNNGVATRYTFTSADQIETEITTGPAGIIFEGAYRYDSHGNLIHKTTTHGADSSLTETTTYTYNAYDQLLGSSIFEGDEPAGMPSKRVGYEVGVTGNVAKETTTIDAMTVERKFGANALGQTESITTTADGAAAVSIAQHYDAAGNLTHGADGTLRSYNLFNQATAETREDGSATTTDYWITGKRKSTTSTDPAGDVATTGYYWDGGALVNDTYSSGPGAASDTGIAASYLFGTTRHTRTLLASNADGETSRSGIDARAVEPHYYVTDRHGSVAVLTDGDGSPTKSYEYSDYGVTTEHAQADVRPMDGSFGHAARNPIQYSAEFTDPNGTQKLGDRDYQPSLASFTTRDVADQFDLYAYVSANPITSVDPTGQAPDPDFVAAGALALVGLIASFAGFYGLLRTTLPLVDSAFLAPVVGGGIDAVVATLQAADTIADASGNGFIEDKDSQTLGILAGIVGVVTGFLAGARALSHKTADALPTSTTPLIQRTGKVGAKDGFKRPTAQPPNARGDDGPELLDDYTTPRDAEIDRLATLADEGQAHSEVLHAGAKGADAAGDATTSGLFHARKAFVQIETWAVRLRRDAMVRETIALRSASEPAFVPTIRSTGTHTYYEYRGRWTGQDGHGEESIAFWGQRVQRGRYGYEGWGHVDLFQTGRTSLMLWVGGGKGLALPSQSEFFLVKWLISAGLSAR